MRDESNPRAVVEAIFRTLNSHDVEGLRMYASADVSNHLPWPLAKPGLDQFVWVHATIFRAFPDAAFEVKTIFASQEFVLIRWVMTGTHRGRVGLLLPTQARVSLPGLELMRIDGGLVREEWAEVDAAALIGPIGARMLAALSLAALIVMLIVVMLNSSVLG